MKFWAVLGRQGCRKKTAANSQKTKFPFSMFYFFELILNPLAKLCITLSSRWKFHNPTDINQQSYLRFNESWSNIWLYLMIEKTTICYSLTPNFPIDFRIINQSFDSINKLLLLTNFSSNNVNY